MKNKKQNNRKTSSLNSIALELIKLQSRIKHIKSQYDKKCSHIETLRDVKIDKLLTDQHVIKEKLASIMIELHLEQFEYRSYIVRLIKTKPKLRIILPELAIESATNNRLIKTVPAQVFIDMDAVNTYFNKTNKVLAGFEMVPSVNEIEIIDNTRKG